jgi:hypothetical protein
MIFLGATLVSTSGKEREEHLDHIKRDTNAQARRRTHCCVRKSLNAALLSVHICTEFLQPIRRFVCHTRPILQHISRTLPSILKNVLESTLYPVGPPVSSNHANAGEQDGVCHNWGMGGRENLQYIGSCIQTADDEFVQVLRGKTSSIKALLLMLIGV